MSGFSLAHWLVLPLFIGLLWVVPVYFGIRNFRRKGYSAHWMWFGILPLPGYIAMIVSFAIGQRRP